MRKEEKKVRSITMKEEKKEKKKVRNITKLIPRVTSKG